jgi:hypothetical protein
VSARRAGPSLQGGDVRHFAFVPTKVRGGVRVDHVTEWPSRGEAERHSLRLLGRDGAGSVASLERDLVSGDVIPADVVDAKPKRS